MFPTIPYNESQRLSELYRFRILDTLPEEDYDQIVQLASQICKTPISFISLIDINRQWIKARVGIEAEETDRKLSFCGHAILGEDVMEVPDTLEDERFADNPFVAGEPNVRFYAGVPLVTANGYKVGSLCVLDSKPRHLEKEELFALKVLARQVMRLLELRHKNLELEQQAKLTEQHKAKLVELSETQKKIISIIAHDVRNPLASLKGIIQLNELKALSAVEVDEQMRILNKQLESTLEMLTNLIEWSQAQLNRKNPHLRPVNLFDVVQLNFNNIEVAAQVKNNRLENRVPKNCSVYADEYMLRFILRNFLSNANKFTSNGTIIISAEIQNDFVTIAVADTGIGMSEKFVQKLFRTDQRQTNLGTDNEKGSGLGLLLTKEFIEKLGSDIALNSREGAGTTFSFTLPVAE